ncbi:hypothetical protein Csa_011543 [Cucumis sativus]|nr:hypothetical protein Csa_011543 [Cucumis sativus]
MGLISNRVERSEIKPGDHIYTYRAVFAYSHHAFLSSYYVADVNILIALSVLANFSLSILSPFRVIISKADCLKSDVFVVQLIIIIDFALKQESCIPVRTGSLKLTLHSKISTTIKFSFSIFFHRVLHPGIFVGGSKVVHFRPQRNLNSSTDTPDFYDSSSSNPSSCPIFPDCGFRQPNSGVVLSCLDCFLRNGSLYCFDYGVPPSVFLSRVRGGTCTTATSDSFDMVIHRAMYLLQNGFGNYNVFENNCEDFALYCKTGLLIVDRLGVGGSGQASSVIGAPLAAILSSPLKLLMPSPVGMAVMTAGMYSMSRYATDIGVRTDVIKVAVEDLPLDLDYITVKIHLMDAQTHNQHTSVSIRLGWFKNEMKRVGERPEIDSKSNPIRRLELELVCFLTKSESGSMANLYVKAVPPTDLNRNTEWFMYPGVWTTYILILFFAWLLVLSVFGCSPGMAWTVVNLSHFAVTYHFFHWKKGTPFAEDQGIYNRLTWWEQIDNGKQLTRNRKFLTVVPVVLYLIASHTTDYQHPMLFLNTLAVIVLVIAKFPHMHKVRIFGINADK